MSTPQVLTLHVLESKGWTNKFFSWWFSSIDSFTRVHDKKLSIAAIVSLITLDVGQVPPSVQQGWPRLLQVFNPVHRVSTSLTLAGYRSVVPDSPSSHKE